MEKLSLGGLWPSAFAGVVLVGFAAWLSWLHWRRHGMRRLVLGLEIFRWGIVWLLFVTLLGPEWVRLERPDSQPEVVVLCDASRSMMTRDVVTSDGVVSRAEWVRRQCEAEPWKPLQKRYRVRVEQFSPMSVTPSAQEGTDINGALEEVLGRSRNLRAVVLLSDGDWNAGKSPVTAATRLRAANVPVFAVVVGSERYLSDLELVDVAAPAYGLLGEQVFIPFAVQSHLGRDVTTTVQLLEGGLPVAQKQIVVPAQARVQEALFWYPQREGTSTLTLRLPVESDEVNGDNNERRFEVSVRRETLRVLVVDSLPRWEYRFLRNALLRDPMVDVHCVLLHPELKPAEGRNYLAKFPSTREALSAYDVVFVGDVGIGGEELSAEDAELLRGLVEQQGSGLVFVPGRRGRHVSFEGTALQELYPVVLDRAQPEGMSMSVPSRLQLTRAGRSHWLTMLADSEDANAAVWEQLPGFWWCAAVLKAKPGADVLGVHETQRNQWGKLPLLVVRAAGNGKVLFLGTDSAWRWRAGVEDLYHYRFWGQVVRWMSYQRHRAAGEGFRVAFAPDRPVQGQTVSLVVSVFDSGGMPLSGGRVSAEIIGPEERSERCALGAVAGGWGVYQGWYEARASGRYRVRVHCEQTGRSFETELLVHGAVREQVGRPAQVEVLREIAAITGGVCGGWDELAGFVERLAGLPQKPPVQRRLRLWCSPWWGGLLLVMLTAYWVGRKVAGLV